MNENKTFSFPVRALGVKSLLSDEYMLSFFKKFYITIESRTKNFKKKKNIIYEDFGSLRAFFFSEVIDRFINDTSEVLNEHFLWHEGAGGRYLSTAGSSSWCRTKWM